MIQFDADKLFDFLIQCVLLAEIKSAMKIKKTDKKYIDEAKKGKTRHTHTCCISSTNV